MQFSLPIKILYFDCSKMNALLWVIKNQNPFFQHSTFYTNLAHYKFQLCQMFRFWKTIRFMLIYWQAGGPDIGKCSMFIAAPKWIQLETGSDFLTALFFTGVYSLISLSNVTHLNYIIYLFSSQLILLSTEKYWKKMNRRVTSGSRISRCRELYVDFNVRGIWTMVAV